MKKKRACIITLYGNFNYGNKLQNYALQTALEKCGFEVTSLKNVVSTSFVKKVYNKLKYFMTGKQPVGSKGRIEAFLNFNEKYMHYTDYMIYDYKNINIIENFDKFVIGSDQVWNHWNKQVPKVMFGLFAPREKVIAYSASFAVPYIEDTYFDQYKVGLANVQHISVREDAGVKIVEDIDGRKVKVTVDPTLLLLRSDWEKVEIKPNFDVPKNYVLSCFIGGQSQTLKEKTIKYAKDNNCDIVNLYDENDMKYFDIGPSEFLYLFHNAKIVLTDSFHASVFSYIYKVPLLTFGRLGSKTNMNSRIHSLLNIFDLKERFIENIEDLNISEYSNCSYDKADINISKLREKSYDYLKNALK